MQQVLVLAFGVMGVAIRYNLYFLNQNTIPLGTLSVNTIGSGIIGWVIFTDVLNEKMKIAIAAGLLGGMTTFSGFVIETLKFLESGKWGLAGFYILISNGLCLGFCFLGKKITEL